MKSHFRKIMGRNCIAEVLKSAPERIVEVYTAQTETSDSLYSELLNHKIPVKRVSKKELSQLVSSESHQSYVAAVKEHSQPTLKDFLKTSVEKDRSLVLMLDSIFDPQNLGAIIRAGECFGVDLVIFSKNRGTDITAVTTKASAGGTELVPLLKVSNLADTVNAFQKEGYWAVTSEVGEKAESIDSFEFPPKTVIILGSEGKGVQPLLSKKCDFHITIPMWGNIDSLNVSQAAAVFLHSYRRQHQMGS